MRLEYPSVRNILVASAIMGLFVGVYRLVVPLSGIWLTLVPVAVGAIMYGVMLLKLDRGIHDELWAMAAQMGVWLPRWLQAAFVLAYVFSGTVAFSSEIAISLDFTAEHAEG